MVLLNLGQPKVSATVDMEFRLERLEINLLGGEHGGEKASISKSHGEIGPAFAHGKPYLRMLHFLSALPVSALRLCSKMMAMRSQSKYYCVFGSAP